MHRYLRPAKIIDLRWWKCHSCKTGYLNYWHFPIELVNLPSSSTLALGHAWAVMNALPDLNNIQSPAATLCVRSVAGEMYARRTSRLITDFKAPVSTSVGIARSVTMADMVISVIVGSNVDLADEQNIYEEQSSSSVWIVPLCCQRTTQIFELRCVMLLVRCCFTISFSK